MAVYNKLIELNLPSNNEYLINQNYYAMKFAYVGIV